MLSVKGILFLYHALKRKVKLLISDAKETWARKTSSNSNCVWQLVKTLKGSNSSVNSNILLEDGSFNYLLNLFKSHLNSNEPIHVFEFDKDIGLDIQVSPYSILKIIDKMSAKKTCGIEGLITSFIKHIAPIISVPLSLIVNKSFKNGIFPDLWKESFIIPVPKCSNPSLDDFRPITITSIFSKIIEKVFLFHYKDNLIAHYGSNQHGYRPYASTNTALAEFNEIVTSALDNKSVKAVRVIFHDLAKAFDKVRHDLLIKMVIDKLGLSVGKFLHSYLTGRKTRLKIDGSFSDFIDCISSVSAGSIVGPYLFNFFVGELVVIFSCAETTAKIIMYCDDLATFESLPLPDSTTHVTATVLIDNWLLNYDLISNPSKSFQMFYNKNSCVNDYAVEGIKIVKEHQYLGVFLSDDFSLKNHVNRVLAKASKSIFILRYLKKQNYITKKELMNVYHCLFLSHILYASTVLTNISCNDCLRINRLIKRCHNVICFRLCNCSLFLTFEQLLRQRNSRLFLNISKNCLSPLNTYLPEKLPSGRFRLNYVAHKYRAESFMVKYCQMYNENFER